MHGWASSQRDPPSLFEATLIERDESVRFDLCSYGEGTSSSDPAPYKMLESTSPQS